MINRGKADSGVGEQRLADRPSYLGSLDRPISTSASHVMAAGGEPCWPTLTYETDFSNARLDDAMREYNRLENAVLTFRLLDQLVGPGKDRDGIAIDLAVAGFGENACSTWGNRVWEAVREAVGSTFEVPLGSTARL